jgi:hypothetical protein
VITSELLPALTLMVLLGLIRGRSTGTRLPAFSWFRRKICVSSWLPLARSGPSFTALPCSFASASGTTLYSPADSTTAKPCSRSAARNWFHAAAGGWGLSLCRFIVPLTRGSTTTLRPVITASVRATASMSALAKLSVTPSPGLTAGWA